MLWPLNEERNGLRPPVLIRDGLCEFGTPPGESWWCIDHPSAMTVQLADGGWHNLLGYRIVEKADLVELRAPAPQRGAYLEEVISAGKPIPSWNF